VRIDPRVMVSCVNKKSQAVSVSTTQGHVLVYYQMILRVLGVAAVPDYVLPPFWQSMPL